MEHGVCERAEEQSYMKMTIKTEVEEAVESTPYVDIEINVDCIKDEPGLMELVTSEPELLVKQEVVEDALQDTQLSEETHPEQRAQSRLYRCDKCPKMFKWKSSLRMHCRCEHGTVSHECTECNLQYKCAEYLAYHMRNVHSYKQYRCAGCKKVYKSKQTLHYHVPRCREPRSAGMDGQRYVEATSAPTIAGDTSVAADGVVQDDGLNVKEEQGYTDMDIGPTVLQYMDSYYSTKQLDSSVVKQESSINGYDLNPILYGGVEEETIEDDCREFAMPKSAAERVREYRARKAAGKRTKKPPKTAAERSREYRARRNLAKTKNPPKTAAERSREYRARKKILETAVIQHNRSTNCSPTSVLSNQDVWIVNPELLSQPGTIDAILNSPGPSRITTSILDQVDVSEHNSSLLNNDCDRHSSPDAQQVRDNRNFIVVQVDMHEQNSSPLNNDRNHHSDSDKEQDQDNRARSNDNGKTTNPPKTAAERGREYPAQKNPAKTAAERGREYRARKNAMKPRTPPKTAAEREREYRAQKNPPKTAAERNREYRARKKFQRQLSFNKTNQQMDESNQ